MMVLNRKENSPALHCCLEEFQTQEFELSLLVGVIGRASVQ